MSSYKPHAIAGMIFTLPFVPSLFYVFFGLIGASIPDLDHNNNKHKIYGMIGFGVVLAILMFFYNSNVISCLILVILGVIFYLSRHRGFTHTLLGIVVLSGLFSFMMMGFLPILVKLGMDLNLDLMSNVFVFLMMAVIGYFVIHRRYFLWYVAILGVYLLFLPVDYVSINWWMVFGMIFVGALSHLILDLRTPAGLVIFNPFLDVKFHKSMAWILFLGWLGCSVWYLYYFNPLF